MNEVRREERIRELYLTQKQENFDSSLTQTSNGGLHLPLGGGTLPRNMPISKGRSPILNHHHKQRSWDCLESGIDDLRGITDAVLFLTLFLTFKNSNLADGNQVLLFFGIDAVF